MRDFHFPGRSAVFASNGMVATSHPLAASTGLEILKSGGNAMDAALAGAVLLGFCEPHMTGLHGDMFALVQRGAGETVEAYNGSGRAPSAASAETLRAAGQATIQLDGPDAITVPGAVAAICDLSESHGKLGLDAILAPSIHYADAGVPVSPRVAFDWSSNAEKLRGHARKWFLKNDQALAAGDIFRAPGQAEVLRRIAKSGASAFYEGEVAEDILSALNEIGGVHTAEDYANARGEPTQPISAEVLGQKLYEHPPNGQGATAVLLLNILAHFDLASMAPFGAQRIHIEAEATKLAYDTRNRLVADPEVFDATKRMLDPDLAVELAKLINPNQAMASAKPLTEALHKDTVLICAVDRDGMAVSLIYSIFHGFGSGHATEKFGLILHNRGAGFTLERDHPNELGPGKRPMHTIIPGLVEERDGGRMAFGVMGGQYQSTGHARMLTNLHIYGMDPQSALDAPRAFADSGKLQLEKGHDAAVIQALAEMGHEIVIPDGPIGGAQMIRIHKSSVIEGASDPRKDGCAIGY